MDKGAEYYALFLNGSDEGIEKIVLEYRSGLQMFLFAQSGDMTFAEEMAQETFVKIFTVRPKYYAKASFRTWLYTVGRNLMRNAMRRKKQGAYRCRAGGIRYGQRRIAGKRVSENGTGTRFPTRTRCSILTCRILTQTPAPQNNT